MQDNRCIKTPCIKIPLLILICFAWLSPPRLLAQEDLTVLDDWLAYQGAGNSLYRHLNSEAQELLSARRQTIAGIASRADWQSYQEKTRKTLDQIVGPFPRRTTLNATVTGIIEKPGFRVEKIIYESRPGFYVTAALFIPKNLSAPAPGILFCSGHTEDGFRSATYQTMILNLVHKGFVVLAFDPFGQGERQDYLAGQGLDAGKSLIGGPTKQHSYAGAQLFLLGQSMANYMIWDGIRGIDYLISRPEVDGNRIGVTGRSGGGTQTAQIAALDERVAAAAPEAYITSFERLLMTRGPQDAEQNFFHGISAGLNHGDLLIVRAPRPTLIIATTRDFFSIQGARETFAEVKRAYSALGAVDAMQMVEDDAGHASTVKNREAMYRFFMEAFGVDGPSLDVNHALLTPGELQVTETGQVFGDREGGSLFSLIAREARLFDEKLNIARIEQPAFLDEVREKARILSGYRMTEDPVTSVFAGQYQRAGYRVEKHFLQGSGEYVVPFLVMKPETEGPHPVIVMLHPEGKQYAAEAGGGLESMVRMGYAVITADLPGTGELGAGDLKGDAMIDGVDLNTWFASILIDKSIVGLQAGDLHLLARYIQGRADLNAQKISGIAWGEASNALIYAAILEEAFTGVALIRPAGSISSLATNKYYAPRFIPAAVAGSLPYYDLSDLQADFSPGWLLIIDPVDHIDSLLDEGATSRQYQFVSKKYLADGYAERLTIKRFKDNHSEQTWDMLRAWLLERESAFLR